MKYKKIFFSLKKIIIILSILIITYSSKATIHIVKVWDGYFQFVSLADFSSDISIQLGDTVQWLPLDVPSMVHTITSTNIPAGAATFDQIWQAPADTFFQYVPTVAGLYEYECTPHAISFGMVGTITVLSNSTSIKANDTEKSAFQFYPNPTTGLIHTTESQSVFTYNVYDLSGKIRLSGQTLNEVNISDFKNGLYFLEIVGEKPQIIRIIKH